MDGWTRVGALDWLCVEPTESTGLAEAGVVLGRGRAHETAPDLGLTTAAVTALVRELNRPRETPDRGVLELTAYSQVDLHDTTIRLVGHVEAVRVGLTALDDALRHPELVDVDRLPPAPRPSWAGWTEELTAWFGMSPAVFATEVDVERPHPPERLRDILAAMHPDRTRAVAWTSSADLVGVAFVSQPSELVTPPPDPHPAGLTWRDPSPTAAGSRSLGPTYRNNLLSAAVPASRADDLAVRLLARTLHRNLVEFRRLATGLEVRSEQIGGRLLVGLLADPDEQGYDHVQATAAVEESLDALAGFPDQVLADELERAHTAAALNVDLAPTGRAIDAHRGGRLLDRATLLDELDAVDVPALRAAIERLRTGLLVGAPAGLAAPDRPVHQTAPALDPVARPTLRRRSRVLEAVPGPAEAGPSLRADDRQLDLVLKPRRPRGVRADAATRQSVDLARLALRVDRGPTTTLIDQDNRRVTFSWPAYLRTGPLRALVDRATPAATRLTLPESPGLAADLRRRLTKWKIGVVVQAVVYAGFAALLIWHPVTGRRYQEPVVATVAVGQRVALANGSTVALDQPRWERSLGRPYQVVTAGVTFCGGGETVSRTTADDARNYADPGDFAVDNINQVSRVSIPLRSGEVALDAAQLAQGQCTRGRIGFEIESGTPPPGTAIRYHNGSGDDVTWRLG